MIRTDPLVLATLPSIRTHARIRVALVMGAAAAAVAPAAASSPAMTPRAAATAKNRTPRCCTLHPATGGDPVDAAVNGRFAQEPSTDEQDCQLKAVRWARCRAALAGRFRPPKLDLRLAKPGLTPAELTPSANESSPAPGWPHALRQKALSQGG